MAECSKADVGIRLEEAAQAWYQGLNWTANKVTDLLVIWGQEDTQQRLAMACFDEHMYQTPGAVQVHRLCLERCAQQGSVQDQVLWTEQACHQESQDIRAQVLHKLRHFHCDQTLTLEEAQAGRVALQQLVGEIREEQQLAWDSFEELCPL
ncbi:hypothetical protein Y1Q_0005522 [Alligator mississippiensis]|uniref:Uncharacterized protein n=1 Tax=Alligator mississippiensis TaxID=8496 RepID=A0A151MEX1_ALLMI|nr:hypothetical protein Y1Q_0005522 [Alligator mississippiensis]